MKKLLYLLLFLIPCASAAYGQTSFHESHKVVTEDEEETDSTFVPKPKARPPFRLGQADICVGIGLMPNNGLRFNSGDFEVTTALPPVSLTADFGVSDAISLGAYVGMSKANVSSIGWLSNTAVGSITYYMVGGRLLYHFDLLRNMDTYGGAMLGYTASTVNVSDAADNVSVYRMAYNVFLGGRYRFSRNVGIFFEVGYGISLANVGLDLKFN